MGILIDDKMQSLEHLFNHNKTCIFWLPLIFTESIYVLLQKKSRVHDYERKLKSYLLKNLTKDYFLPSPGKTENGRLFENPLEYSFFYTNFSQKEFFLKIVQLIIVNGS